MNGEMDRRTRNMKKQMEQNTNDCEILAMGIYVFTTVFFFSPLGHTVCGISAP